MPQTTEDAEKQAYHLLYQQWPRLWLAVYHHRTTRDTQMDFTDRPWLIDLYKDDSSYIVIKKASQVCISEWAFCEFFRQAMQGRPTMYILPTDRIVYEVTPRRIDRLIERVPFYRQGRESRVGKSNLLKGRKDSDTKSQKTLFGTDCNIVGANQVLNFFEKPVDVLIFDELDKCDQNNLVFAMDRLGSAENSLIRKLGNPTEANFGIDAEYEASDKKQWHIKCEHCGEWQPLDWFQNIVRQEDDGHFISLFDDGGKDLIPLCRHCNGTLDRLADGEWIAEYPDRDISGRFVSKLFAKLGADTLGLLPLRSLFRTFTESRGNPSKEQHFWNNDLGLAYSAGGSKITEQVLAACCDSEYEMPMKAEGTIAGVDIGNRLHLNVSKIIDGKRKKVFVGILGDYQELHHICKRLGVQIGVMDAGPEIHEPRQFVRAHPGWYLCRYNREDKMRLTGKNRYQDMDVDYVARTISINRTESLDCSFEDYVDNRIVLPFNYRSLDNGDFVKQMCMPTRIRKERPDGTFRHVWTKGEDHHRHADNYEAIAARLYSGVGSMITVVEV